MSLSVENMSFYVFVEAPSRARSPQGPTRAQGRAQERAQGPGPRAQERAPQGPGPDARAKRALDSSNYI